MPMMRLELSGMEQKLTRRFSAADQESVRAGAMRQQGLSS